MCISSCITQDHPTWGACRRANGLRIGFCRSATNPADDFSADKRWHNDLDAYASARAQGVQPDSTAQSDVRHALDESDRVGAPYGG